MGRQRADRGSKRSRYGLALPCCPYSVQTTALSFAVHRDSLREDLERRCARAVEVNATPLDETADAKRRRVGRRYTARSRFNTAMRELDLLSLEVPDNDAVEHARRVSTEHDVDQEGKQEEDDAPEHQFRAAERNERVGNGYGGC